MAKYVLKRLLQIIPITIGVSILVFTMLSFAPGDPARLALGVNATQEQLYQFKEDHGLNDPYPIQYINYVKRAIQGDLGQSYISKQQISDMVKIRLPNTLRLSLTGIALIVIVQIPLGIALAVKQNSIFDNTMRIITLILASMPEFWLGLMLMLLFSVKLRWLPSTGFDSVRHMIMPVICASTYGWASGSRLTRASMLEVIRQDYIKTARAKGLDERIVIRKHALKNALMPTITSIGVSVGFCFGGSIVIEQLFSINGMGKMLVEALRQKDMPVIMGGVIIIAVLIALTNLLTDLAYAAVDPRIRSLYVTPKKIQQKEVTSNA